MISRDQAAQFYQGVTRIAPTEAEIDTYSAAEDTAAAIDSIIADVGAETARVVTYYQIFYNRLPDLPGLDFWTGQVRGPGLTDQQLASAFFGAGEFEILYGDLPTEDAVRALYENVLGREADQPGLEFWTGQVTADNGFGLRELGLAFAQADETGNTFTPLLEGYLEDLAQQDETPPTLFGYDDKSGDGPSFDGDDGKQEIQTLEILDKGDGPGGITTQNAIAADVMNLDDLRADPRFSGIDGSGFTVAVIDTGIDLDHPAFGPTVGGVSERIVAAIDFTPEFDGPNDVQGHGSNVASIVASEAPGYLGVAPGANIAGLQALGNNGSGSNADIEQALQWVVANAEAYNIVAVNMSLGNGSNVPVAAPNPTGYADELTALANLGVVVTAASGNSYFDYQFSGSSDLSADPNAISVGAVWDEAVTNFFWNGGGKDFQAVPGQITSFSQRAFDPSIDTIFAPGALIVGAAPGGGTSSQGGTSQAAPQVAGMVALAQQIAVENLGRRLTVDEFEQVMRAGAGSVSDPETANDNVINTGATYDLFDALGMAEAILSLGGGGGTPPPPPPPGGDDIPGDESSTEQLATSGTRNSRIDFAGDSDWFRIQLAAGSTYEFALQGAPSGNGTLADPLLNLRDASGRIVATDDDSGEGLEAGLGFIPGSSGTYYVEARAYGDGIGTYRLSSTVIASNDDFPATTATPSVLVPGVATFGEIEELGDHDWHRLDIVAGESYDVFLTGEGGGGGTLRDPYIRLFDDQGTELLANDDFEGLDSAIGFIANETTSVYVNAGAFNDGGTGTYEILVATEAGTGEIPGDPSTGAGIAPGEEVAGLLDFAGDTDWYAVELQSGIGYGFELLGAPSGAGDLADPLLRVFDSQGREVAFDDDGGNGFESFLEFRPTASGTYYVSAEAYAGTGEGTYLLRMADAGGGGGGEIRGDAGTLETIAPGQVAASDLFEPGDTDWFRTTLVAGETYVFDLRGAPSGVGTLSDPLVALYNEQGGEIAFNDDGGQGLESELVFTAPLDGTYFVSAESYAGLYAGTYELGMTSLGGGGGGGAPGADLIPADPSTPVAAALNGSVAETLQFPGDRDWFAIDLVAGLEYVIELQGAPSGLGTLPDPLLRIYDDFGDFIASDDDGRGDLESELAFVPGYTGTHYLEAAAFADQGAGTYTLTVTGEASGDLVPGDPSTTFQAFLESPLQSSVDFPGDEDWFEIVFEAGETYVIDLAGAGAGFGTLEDSFVAVYDDFGTPLASDDDSGEDRDSLLEFTADYTGIHYIGASAFGDEIGTYDLFVFQLDSDPDDGTVVFPDTAVTGAIDEPGDTDDFVAPLVAGVEYDIFLSGVDSGLGTLPDPVLSVFDPFGIEVAANDDIVPGLFLDSAVTFIPSVSGDYILQASGFGDTEGTYTLELFEFV